MIGVTRTDGNREEARATGMFQSAYGSRFEKTSIAEMPSRSVALVLLIAAGIRQIKGNESEARLATYR